MVSFVLLLLLQVPSFIIAQVRRQYEAEPTTKTKDKSVRNRYNGVHVRAEVVTGPCVFPSFRFMYMYIDIVSVTRTYMYTGL